MKKTFHRIILFGVSGAMLLLFCCFPLSVYAEDDVTALKEQIQIMKQQLEAVQEKLAAIETANTEKEAEIEEIDDRLNKAELHTATDKIAFGVELRTRAESIHYDNILSAPPALIGGFFTPAPAGFNGATLAQVQGAMAAMAAGGMVPPPMETDVDNDIIYTNKFRLNLSSKFNDQLSFGGRIAAYKVFGDSTGVKFNQGSLGDVTFDGNTTSLPHGDTLRLERIFFNYKTDMGSIPVHGRPPAGIQQLQPGRRLATGFHYQLAIRRRQLKL